VWAQPFGRAFGVADEGANVAAARSQLADDRAADVAGGACDEHGHHAASALGGMLAFWRKTLSGS
jgi:hypothetical protein